MNNLTQTHERTLDAKDGRQVHVSAFHNGLNVLIGGSGRWHAAYLDRDEAIALRDHLNSNYPDPTDG